MRRHRVGLQETIGSPRNAEARIRRFILDAQKKHNPLDYRVFKILRNALRRALDSKDVFVLEGDPKIANATVLGFSPWTDPETVRCASLDEGVRSWCDDLLPDLVTARPSERHLAAKRGGDARKLTLDALDVRASLPHPEIVALDDALDALSAVDSVRYRIVLLRFFVGLTEKEIAGELGISVNTVNRKWQAARKWLLRELSRAGEPG